jgi:hypothetical protein
MHNYNKTYLTIHFHEVPSLKKEGIMVLIYYISNFNKHNYLVLLPCMIMIGHFHPQST